MECLNPRFTAFFGERDVNNWVNHKYGLQDFHILRKVSHMTGNVPEATLKSVRE